VLPTVRAGQSEREIAAALEGALRRGGSEWHPFPTIVASGPRSALPHARTSARTVGRGEWLLIDFGAQVDGYCADLTRTVVVGARADDRQRAMYELVRSAQQRALEHLRPGMTGREGDRAESNEQDSELAAGGSNFNGCRHGQKLYHQPLWRRSCERPIRTRSRSR
jgi:Xaa-Pro aminopeptidase